MGLGKIAPQQENALNLKVGGKLGTVSKKFLSKFMVTY